MDSLLRDLRYGWHMLAKSPGFTAAALVALALGIGANSAIFSVVNAVLIRPLPFDDPQRLVMLSEVANGTDLLVTSPANFVDWKEQSQTFEDMGAFARTTLVQTGQAEPQLLKALSVSSNLFAVLGRDALLGRTFLTEDREAEAQEVVLSHEFWQRHFSGREDAVGKTMTLDGRNYNVVGVMPRDFRLVRDVEIYALGPQGLPQPPFAYQDRIRDIRTGQYLAVVGRLASGVTLERAQAEMDTIAGRLETQYPETNKGSKVGILGLRERLYGSIRGALLVLSGAVGFVLLIACANVVNLLLSRAASREREIAIRAAHGAQRGRLIRQLLSEGVLLSLLGGALGLLLAVWGVRILIRLVPDNLPRLDQVSIDGRVLAFTLAISLLAGALVSLIPALQLSRPNLQTGLQEGGAKASASGKSRYLFAFFAVTEIAVALVLLVGAGLLITSLTRLLNVDPGFDATNVLTMQITLPEDRYPNPPYVVTFNEQLTEQLRNVPGLVSAGTTSELPLGGVSSSIDFEVPGRPAPPGEKNVLGFHQATAGYLKAMGIPLLAGRDFGPQDRQGVPFAVIVNQTLAERYFGGANPIGHAMRIGGQDVNVIGLMGDVRHSELQSEPQPEILVSALQLPSPSLWLVMRAQGDPNTVLPTVRERVLSVDGNLPVNVVRPMEELLVQSTAQQRFTSSLLGLLAVIALLLALVGIYSVISFSVSQRTHEIGIRLALGAQKRDVFGMVVRQGAVLALIGVVVGALAALGLTKSLSSLLFGVSSTDPLIFVVLSLVLAAVALMASFIPARRAAATSPMMSLRGQ